MSTVTFPRILVAPPLLLALALVACSDDDDDAPTPVGGQPTAGATESGGGGATATQQPGTSPGGSADSIDVCALVSAEDIEAIVGEPVPEGEAEESPPPFAACRYESDDSPRVITIGVIAWDEADDA